MKLIFLVLCLVIAQSHAIDWQGDWAQNCDFPQGNDIKGVATSGDKCSGVCESTSGCTHFVFINGMCYLKSGDIGKKNAFYKAGAVCGVVNGNSGNHGQGGESKGKGKILWQDEFDGSGAPWGQWDPVTANAYTYNNEKQRYTNMENCFQNDGKLVIEGRKDNGEYTSGRIWTKKHFKYGYFEARVQFAPFHGSWGAFWLLPKPEHDWPRSGEIDIVEYTANQNGWVQSNPISGKYGPKSGDGSEQRLVGQVFNDAAYTFHTYAVDWTPDSLKFYMDDKLIKDWDHPGREVYSKWEHEQGGGWPYDGFYSIILNLAIGGDMAELGGGINDNEIWNPGMNKMYVDYVRVYDNGHNQMY